MTHIFMFRTFISILEIDLKSEQINNLPKPYILVKKNPCKTDGKANRLDSPIQILQFGNLVINFCW